MEEARALIIESLFNDWTHLLEIKPSTHEPFEVHFISEL
jgi:hypothetical protein